MPDRKPKPLRASTEADPIGERLVPLVRALASQAARHLWAAAQVAPPQPAPDEADRDAG